MEQLTSAWNSVTSGASSLRDRLFGCAPTQQQGGRTYRRRHKKHKSKHHRTGRKSNRP